MVKNNRFLARNQQVRLFFMELEKRHPEWRVAALETKTANQFFISERTVRAILKGDGIYSETAVN